MLKFLMLAGALVSGLFGGPPPKGRDLAFTVIEQGVNSGVKKQSVQAIRSKQALDAFLKARGSDGKPYRNINWTKDQLLVVYGGQQPSGGYRVEVKRVSLPSASKMVVEARLIRPAPNTIVTLALTTPYTVVRAPLKKTAVSVKFLTDEAG
jgi:hypothetical protein